MNSFDKSFEKTVESSLLSCFLSFDNVKKLAVACSGGADSVSLLLSVFNILKNYPQVELVALTVDHGIRSEAESGGDAAFVEEICKNLGIRCIRHNIENGIIAKLARENQLGIEAQARKFRYEIFEKYIEEEKIDYVLTAHNLNDQTETVLMRFLNGSSGGELRGIPFKRGKYLRPLLGVSRNEIEEYLLCKKQCYKTDATNFDNELKRNLIRNELVPFLNAKFPSWQKGIINVSRKSAKDYEYFEWVCAKEWENCGFLKDKTCVSFDLKGFNSLFPSVKERLLYKLLDSLGDGSEIRIPFTFIENVEDYLLGKNGEHFEGCGYSFNIIEDRCVCEKQKDVATERSFFAIIEEESTYYFEDFFLKVCKKENSMILDFTLTGEESSKQYEIGGLTFPFIVRNRQAGDEIKTGSGSFKSLSKIFKDWKAEDLKNRIPLIQELDTNELKAICGSIFNLKDWIVK